MRQQKVVVGPGQDVDDGIAEADDIEASAGDGGH
jgi:hypothetical protein